MSYYAVTERARERQREGAKESERRNHDLILMNSYCLSKAMHFYTKIMRWNATECCCIDMLIMLESSSKKIEEKSMLNVSLYSLVLYTVLEGSCTTSNLRSRMNHS